MNTGTAVFSMLHRSGGMTSGKVELYRNNGSWPLPYCHKHRLHESPVPNTWAYCPWLDPMRRDKLLEIEHRLDERKRSAPTSKGALEAMGLATNNINTNAALKALRGMGL